MTSAFKKPWTLQARQWARDRKWYVKLSGGNGMTMLRSNGYSRQEAAETLCKLLQSNDIDILERCGAFLWVRPTRTDGVGLWHNTLSGGSNLLMRSEGYARRDAAERACDNMRNAWVITLPSKPLP